MRGLPDIARQQGRERRRGQEGASGGGEGGRAAVVAKGLWVVAVHERGVSAHGGGLARQRFSRQRCGVDLRRELLVGEVRVRDEGAPHAVVAGQHVGAWTENEELSPS